MFYLTKRIMTNGKPSVTPWEKSYHQPIGPKTFTLTASTRRISKNKPFVYVKTGSVKGNLTDKMIKNIPRQGWKDFILSLPEDDWKDKTVIFISREGSIVEPSPLPDQVDYTASHLEWIAISPRTEKPTFTLISKPKYIYDQIIEGRGNKKSPIHSVQTR